jgi:hypothetical protein
MMPLRKGVIVSDIETLTAENEHLRGLLMGVCRQLAAAGFEGTIDVQLAGVLEKARRAEECERELAAVRERTRELEGGSA